MSESYESDWDESYDDYYYRQQQAMAQQAAEAQRHAAAASAHTYSPGGFAGYAATQQYGNSQGAFGSRNAMADADAARWADRSALAAQRSAYHDARTQQEFEKNVIKNESERKKFDSVSARDLGMYSEDTKRKHSDNVTGAMRHMSSTMGGVLGGLTGNAGKAPGMALYGAGGQSIGGGGFAQGRSPLASLMG